MPLNPEARLDLVVNGGAIPDSLDDQSYHAARAHGFQLLVGAFGKQTITIEEAQEAIKFIDLVKSDQVTDGG